MAQEKKLNVVKFNDFKVHHVCVCAFVTRADKQHVINVPACDGASVFVMISSVQRLVCLYSLE